MKNFSLKTKKNYHQDSGSVRIAKVAGYTLLTLVAIFVGRLFFSSVFASSTEVIIRVREYFAHSAAVFPTYIRSRSELEKIITGFEEEIAKESGNRATIARLVHENEELRALLGDSGDERILAGVIARPPATPYDMLMIDRGSAHGIKEGVIVYHTNGHAIGMVSRVYETMSLVTLFSTSGVETTVYVYGPDVFAYAYGEGGGVMRISLPQGIKVTEGDSVVLPSLSMGNIGVIERVISVPTQPEQSAYVTFPVPIQSLHNVTVGTYVADIPSVTDLEAGVERIRERFRVEVPDAIPSSSTTATSTI
jgi:cell shape-determining protein MreC